MVTKYHFQQQVRIFFLNIFSSFSLYSVQTWEPGQFKHGVGNKPTLPDFIGSKENDYGESLFGGSKPLPTVVISYEDYGEDKYLQDLKQSISKIQNGGTRNMTFKTETKNACLSICKNNDIFRVRIVLKSTMGNGVKK